MLSRRRHKNSQKRPCEKGSHRQYHSRRTAHATVRTDPLNRPLRVKKAFPPTQRKSFSQRPFHDVRKKIHMIYINSVTYRYPSGTLRVNTNGIHVVNGIEEGGHNHDARKLGYDKPTDNPFELPSSRLGRAKSTATVGNRARCT